MVSRDSNGDVCKLREQQSIERYLHITLSIATKDGLKFGSRG